MGDAQSVAKSTKKNASGSKKTTVSRKGSQNKNKIHDTPVEEVPDLHDPLATSTRIPGLTPTPDDLTFVIPQNEKESGEVTHSEPESGELVQPSVHPPTPPKKRKAKADKDKSKAKRRRSQTLLNSAKKTAKYHQ